MTSSKAKARDDEEEDLSALLIDVSAAAHLCGVGDRRMYQVLAKHGVKRPKPGLVRLGEAVQAYLLDNFPEVYRPMVAEAEREKLAQRVAELEGELAKARRRKSA